MFEKEAEERARKLEESQTLGVYDNDEDYARDSGWNDGEVAGYEEGFIDGAEFGYNKANEWHYPSKGELPKDGETVFVCRDDMQIWTGNRHSKRENSYFWYIHNLHGVLYKDSDIYAWKEIVPPKEIENA